MRGKDFLKIISEPFRFWKIRNRKISSINDYEYRVFSQNGEDGILRAIFHKIRTTNKFFVEFGVQNGCECNTRYLRKMHGWHGLMMDGARQKNPMIHKEWITAENINDLLKKYQVPVRFDLLSIDIDSNEYWIWKAMEGFYPRVVVIEYNSSIPPNQSLAIEYDPAFVWDKTSYYGASILALEKLGRLKGYRLIGCDRRGINAFFAQSELWQDNFEEKKITALYRPPGFGDQVNNLYIGYPPSNKKMVLV